MRLLTFALALSVQSALVSSAYAAEPTALAAHTDVAAVKVGEQAPAFTLVDTAGKTHHLADYKGKIVVIEWFNPGCPFVQAAHGTGGPLVDQPAKWTKQGVVWLAVNSSALGKEGYGLETNATARTTWGMDYPVLLDEKGTVGKAYGSKNTPTMYIVDKDGKLVYAGALDTAPLLKADGVVTNWVDKALGEIAAGQPVATAQTKAYGCSVKYAE